MLGVNDVLAGQIAWLQGESGWKGHSFMGGLVGVEIFKSKEVV